MADTDLQRAIQAVRRGDGDEARRILAALIGDDPQNEDAWLWLSQVVRTDRQRRECLERVLRINPENRLAQAGLQRLSAGDLASHRAVGLDDREEPRASAAPPENATPASPLSNHPYLRRLIQLVPLVSESQAVYVARSMRQAGRRLTVGLAHTRPLGWFAAQVHKRTGTELSETAAVLFFVGGIVTLSLLCGLLVAGDFVRSALAILVLLGLALLALVVFALLLLVAIGWVREQDWSLPQPPPRPQPVAMPPVCPHCHRPRARTRFCPYCGFMLIREGSGEAVP